MDFRLFELKKWSTKPKGHKAGSCVKIMKYNCRTGLRNILDMDATKAQRPQRTYDLLLEH